MNRSKFHLIILLLCSAIAIGQTATPPIATAPAQSSDPNIHPAPPVPSFSQTPTQPAAPPESLVPESEAVITIDGVCDVTPNGTVAASERTGVAAAAHNGATRTTTHTGASAKPGTAASHSSSASTPSKDCKTQITREEFEKVIKAVAPAAPPQVRRQIATRYAQLLIAANEGVKLHVEKDPEFPAQLAVARLQVLANSAERMLQAQATNVSDAELKNYYDQNPSAFEEVSLTRLFVPHIASDKTDSSADPKAIAENGRQQLMIGGDPEKIEKSIYEQLKNSTQPPPTKFGKRRRGTLPVAEDQKLFGMKEDEISDVITEPGGYVVYRVDSKRQIQFEDAKDEIKQRVTRQRITDEREQMTSANKPVFNDTYFGPEVTPRTGPTGAANPGAQSATPAPIHVQAMPPPASTGSQPASSTNPK